MIINKLILNNFGIFYGSTTINFNAANSNKPIILLGGQNGSGKTTILQAIKLGLYGSLMFGFRTNSKQYNDYLIGKFNTYALKEWNNTSSVSINFTLKQAGIITNYEITREWNLSANKIIEETIVEKNGHTLDEKQTSDFESFLRKFIPPALFDFFFFDGEEISKLIEQEDFEEVLKGSVLTLFNLDIFETLRNDLENYLQRENIFKDLSKEEQALSKVLSDIAHIQGQIEEIDKSILNLENEIGDKTTLINSLENEFKLHGGLLEDEIKLLKEHVNELEVERKQTNETLKVFASELLPFVICKDLLSEVQEQINTEQEIIYYNELNKRLDNEIYNNLNTKFTKYSFKASTEHGEELNMSQILKILISELSNTLKPEININEFNIIHNLSPEEIRQITSLAHEVSMFDPSTIQKQFQRISEITLQIQELKNNISSSIDNYSLTHLWEQRKILDVEINQLKTLLIKNQEQKVFHEENLMVAKAEAERLDKKVKQAAKDRNAFVMSKKVDLVLTQYIQIQNKLKIKEVESRFNEMFSNIIRKDNFVTSIKIDDATFKVELYNKDQLVPKSSLSAGEKQIYILSLLWAFIKASNRHIPLIFDTLLGRLDHLHKTNIIKYFLPHASEQTIILSTDTEIDNYYYKLIEPHIASEYLLEYDQQKHAVRILNQYFPAEVIRRDL